MEEIEDTWGERILSQRMITALTAHFHNAVPIDRLFLDKRQKEVVARVEHVYWIYMKNPFLDVHAMFYEMSKQRHKDRSNAHRLAKIDERVFEWVRDNTAPPSRKDRENKVRFAADTLMKRGLQSGNDRALAKGAELSIKVDRLDQPEDQRADMSRAAFLPSVVITDISQMDDTKQNVDDEESIRIMRKYNAYVDEKRDLVDGKVKSMMARRDTGYEQDRSEPGSEQ